MSERNFFRNLMLTGLLAITAARGTIQPIHAQGDKLVDTEECEQTGLVIDLPGFKSYCFNEKYHDEVLRLIITNTTEFKFQMNFPALTRFIDFSKQYLIENGFSPEDIPEINEIELNFRDVRSPEDNRPDEPNLFGNIMVNRTAVDRTPTSEPGVVQLSNLQNRGKLIVYVNLGSIESMIESVLPFMKDPNNIYSRFTIEEIVNFLLTGSLIEETVEATAFQALANTHATYDTSVKDGMSAADRFSFPAKQTVLDCLTGHPQASMDICQIYDFAPVIIPDISRITAYTRQN